MDDSRPRGIRVLFLIPEALVADTKPIFEREKLPYFSKPYHLHDFLEKVSDLLVATGSIEDPIRSMTDFAFGSRAQRDRADLHLRKPHANPMFASRDDYQMTEEECSSGNAPKKKPRRNTKSNSKKSTGTNPPNLCRTWPQHRHTTVRTQTPT